MSALQPIGYPNCGLGLNNQKIALFGLFYRAYKERVPLVLPEFAIFDATGKTGGTVPLDIVYSVESLKRFAAIYGIEIIDDPSTPYQDINGWHAFETGARRLTPDGSRGITALNEFMSQFYRSLKPRITETEPFKKLNRGVFENSGISVTTQLRIERDWINYSNTTLKGLSGTGEDYLPSFQRIMEKIRNTFPDTTNMIYVVCDEANLPTTKDEIRKDVYQRHGIYPLWKSDVLSPAELADFSLLDLSIIDFEMSVRSPLFVGVTRSTFSMLAGFESFSRRRAFVLNQYIYDDPGDFVLQRFDNGATNAPAKATNRLLLRERLIAETREDCSWPLSLTAHIATHGDFTSSGPDITGVRAGPLICGVRNDPRRAIEGFEITFLSEPPCGTEYQALLHDHTWTPWTSSGAFVGARGTNKAILGFAVRLTGPLAARFDCICAGSFTGDSEIIEVRGGARCEAKSGAKLVAMQIVIRPAG